MEKATVNVLFVTGLLSPFQLDLTYAINAQKTVNYYIAFTIPSAARRGKHWNVEVRAEYQSFVNIADDGLRIQQQGAWLTGLIQHIAPNIVLTGFYKGPLLPYILDACRKNGAKLAFWNEPPNLQYPRWLVRFYAKIILRKNLNNAQFMLAIGDRAAAIYRQNFAGSVYLVPYGQDLSHHLNIRKSPKTKDEKVYFLFSGQLVPCHNIHLIAKTLLKLYERYPKQFCCVVAGYGPEESTFLNIIAQHPGLKQLIVYDRDYEFWEDRVRPFSYSDVLLYPSKHSGWGLVIPEAMAANLTVISTKNVEAARYYIEHGVNGFLIEPYENQLYEKMTWCLERRNEMFAMGARARHSVYKGTAEHVAKQFCTIIQEEIFS